VVLFKKLRQKYSPLQLFAAETGVTAAIFLENHQIRGTFFSNFPM
jgi:hypothetical protein